MSAARRAGRVLLAGLALAPLALAAPFETPPAESPAGILPPALAAGPGYHVAEPVASDGLVRHYRLETPYGAFEAYGRVALEARVREARALGELAKISKVEIVAGGVGRGVVNQVQTAVGVVAHPIKTVTGIPRGISHLLRGYEDQAGEAAARVKRATAGSGAGGGPGAAAGAGEDAVKRYAERYLGISAAERRWYRQLGVDPYTDNATLRATIRKDAKLEAGAGFGMRFVGLPAIPGIGLAARAEEAIYNEDPATVRRHQRETLAGFGLEPGDIDAFENAPALSPTHQVLLAAAAGALEGVEGRAELIRHAIGLTSAVEAQVYLQSAGLLVLAHRAAPLAALLPGVRLPAARRADGSLVVAGAFEAVYWTAEVAADEAELRAALPAGAIRELWLDGSASAAAREALTALGWTLRENAGAPAPGG